jgi:hypothetical protein
VTGSIARNVQRAVRGRTAAVPLGSFFKISFKYFIIAFKHF